MRAVVIAAPGSHGWLLTLLCCGLTSLAADASPTQGLTYHSLTPTLSEQRVRLDATPPAGMIDSLVGLVLVVVGSDLCGGETRCGGLVDSLWYYFQLGVVLWSVVLRVLVDSWW